MKKNLLLCSVSIILLSAGVASARKAPYQNIIMAGSWSTIPAPVSSNTGPAYRNIADAARWSTLPRPVAGGLTRKTVRAHAQDPSDPDELFGIYGTTWKGCVRQCIESALQGTGTMCATYSTCWVLVG